MLDYKQQRAVNKAIRIIRESMAHYDVAYTNPKLVKDYLTCKIAKEEREHFVVMFLDNRHRLIKDEILFSGTVDGAKVYSREVVKRALALNAAAVIFEHNHPSGVADPSAADQRLTQDLIRALGTVDIRVLDHFVVGADEVVSFAERGLL